MLRLPARVLRPGYRVAYLLIVAYSWIFRPHTRGVKCLVTCGDEVLLVRHSYGPGEWDLPGGFCRRGEGFADAARRELSEELGVEDARWTDLGELRRRFNGRHETLHGFRAELAVRTAEVRSAEIAESRWCAREALPDPLAPIVHSVAALDAGAR